MNLCSLNHVLNVNFKMTSEYSNLDGRARRKNLKKLLAHLTRKCFNVAWVIIIDDAELVDDESISLFHTVAKLKNLLFVLTYGNKLSRAYLIPPRIANDARVKY